MAGRIGWHLVCAAGLGAVSVAVGGLYAVFAAADISDALAFRRAK